MSVLNPPVLIEGVRLRLRRSTPADAPWTYAAANHPDVMRHMDWPAHRGVEDAHAYLDGCAARWAAGTEFHWVIEHKAQGQPIGAMACRPKGHAVDFGYFLGRAHWGQGLGTEAAQLLVGWLQRQPEVLRIWATCDADNVASAAVLHKAGLVFEGRLRRATLRPNRGPGPYDTLVYAWVREEPQEESA